MLFKLVTKVGAIVAVNALGDIINPNSGEIIAGALNCDKKRFCEHCRCNDRAISK